MWILAADLVRLICEVSLLLRLSREAEVPQDKTTDLTERDKLVLELLGKRNRVRVSDIAKALSTVSESTISTGLTKLWRKGLIEKSSDDADQRITVIELRTEGEKALERITENQTAVYRMLLEAIKISAGERVILEKLIPRAIAFFEEILERARQSP